MNYNDFSHEINRMTTNMTSSLIEPNPNSNQNSSNRSCLERCQKMDPHEYNESGKPLKLHYSYDSSGRPLRYSNLNRIGGSDLESTYNSSGKVFHSTDFLRNGAHNGQGSIKTYNTSGRSLHSSDLPESSNKETGAFSSFVRGIDPQTYENCRFQQSDWQTCDASGLPLISSKFTDVRTNDLSDTDRICTFQSCSANDITTKQTDLDSWNKRQKEKTENLAGSCLEQIQWPQCHPNDEAYSIAGRNLPTSTQDMPECSHLSQRQWFDLLKKRHADKIASNNYFEVPLFNALVKDNYYPGAIEDAVNGKIKFNKIAFDAVFNSDPPMKIKPDDVPLTLLEAFELRVRFEENIRTNPSTRSRCCAFQKEEKVIESKDETEEIPDKLPFWVHPDELKLASTVDIDLELNVRENPETALTHAIASLFRAEKINEFDKKVHVAEEAMRSVPPDQKEKAALISTPSFKLNLQKGEKVTTKSYRPIEIVSYIGTTKPNE